MIEYGSAVLPARANVRDYVMVDDGYAADRIVDKMLQHANGEHHLDVSFGNATYWRRRMKDAWHTSWARLPRVKPTNRTDKFPGLVAGEIETAIADLRNMVNRFHSVHFRRITPNAYLLQNEA